MATALEVFTPTTSARLTFVDRADINDRLVEALQTPGKQVVVYGHSGSGKTTLLRNKLHQLYENHLTTQCIAGMTFDQIVCDAFGQLGVFYEAGGSQTAMHSGGLSLAVKYASIKVELFRSSSSQGQVNFQRLLPPQLTPQTLAQFLGAARCCWVLEDFHKILPSEKTRLAQVMKCFVDAADDFPYLRIVAIGAVDTARQVVEYEPEMRNRVAEIQVPLMKPEEIELIIKRGEHLLNVVFQQDVSAGISHYAHGLASVCHQLCLNMCNASDVVETCRQVVRFDDDDLRAALRSYIQAASDTLKATFDKALRVGKRARYHDAELISKALMDVADDGATMDELQGMIRAGKPDYPRKNLRLFLKALQGPERGSLLRFDSASGRYSFADPIYQVYAKTKFKKPVEGQAVVAFMQEMIDALNGLLTGPPKKKTG